MSKEEEKSEDKKDDNEKEIEEKKEINENNNNNNEQIEKEQINIKLQKNDDENNKNIKIKKITVNRDEIKQKKLNKEEENEKSFKRINKELNNLNELSIIADSKLDKLIKRTFKISLKKKLNSKTPQSKLLLAKEMQLKNDQVMLKNLLNENDKLKKLNESLNKKLINAQDFKNYEKMSLKDIEIKELKKKISELSASLSEIKSMNTALSSKNAQLEDIIFRYKKKLLELKSEKSQEKNKNIDISLKKRAFNNNNISLIKENRLLKSASSNNFIEKKQNQTIREMLNDSFYHLLSDKQKDSLKNIFNSNEEFLNFIKKVNIIETRNKKIEEKLERQISELNDIVNVQKKENDTLKDDIKFKENKIAILERKLNQLKSKNKMLINNNKKNLEENKNILINKNKEELNKEYIEKCKQDEIIKINKEIGNIYLIDTKFFENLSKKKNEAKDK